jgi:L-aminopeptidase/D-esterase-like protein
VSARLVAAAGAVVFAASVAVTLAESPKPRGRDLGIPFPGKTGPLNAITDVPGVAVGHVTLISGEGRLVPGQGPVRTGVTAILTRPKGDWDFVMAATFNQNGNGDMTGVNWIAESGYLEGPILLTGTHSVGVVRDAAVQWQEARGREFEFTYPIVSETFDSLSDSTGQHVKPAHVFQALDAASGGRVLEGGVGGGTGMICNGFKGGIGTSSRIVSDIEGRSYTVGVLVQCNYGGDLQILGAPVGREIADLKPCIAMAGTPSRSWLKDTPPCEAARGGAGKPKAQARDSKDGDFGRGSIVVIVATDAPFLPNQLERLAKRVGMGLGRIGSWAGNESGDLFLAFSTANRSTAAAKGESSLRMVANQSMDPFFRATIQAVEEAVVNAMLAADTMTGADGLRVDALPADRVVNALRKYGRMP